MTRPAFPEWFEALARTVATRADCSRRKVGAIIVRDNRLVATGYNGALPGETGCLEGGCPRASSDAVPGSQYDHGPGACIAIHAELNAVLYAARHGIRVEGCIMYVTTQPCDTCYRLIRQAGIAEIVFDEPLNG